MSSFTSSSRQELKVVIFVLAVLLGVEIVMRCLGSSFSAEVRYLRDIPERAETMARSGKFRVLVLGNSLTNCGFNSQAFKMEMDSMGAGPLHVEVVAMDGAHICEWNWILQNFFWDNNLDPDLIIVNGAGLWQDDKNPEISRLVLYMDAADILPAFAEDITGFGLRMEFLHSYALSSYANRKRVRLMVLNRIVPHYQNGSREVHRVARLPNRTTDKVKTPKFTYRQVTRLVNGASQRRIPVIFVIMPMERIYDLQAGFPGAVRSADAEIADCRDASSMLQGRFVDGNHMDEGGARIFSRELARRLRDQFPHLFGRPGADSRAGKKLSSRQERRQADYRPDVAPKRTPTSW